MLHVYWYKVAKVSEEPTASFVRVQAVREEDPEFGGKRILRHVVTMHGST
jgi:hypothetical protein